MTEGCPEGCLPYSGKSEAPEPASLGFFCSIVLANPMYPLISELGPRTGQLVLLEERCYEIRVILDGMISRLKSFEHVGIDSKRKHAHRVVEDVQEICRHKEQIISIWPAPGKGQQV